MKKLKGQGTAIKWCARKLANFHKKSFIQCISSPSSLASLALSVSNKNEINYQVVSFSSTKDFNEQVLSVLSFVKHVGNPVSWIIYSDGTHTSAQITAIESSFVFIKVINENFDSASISKVIKPVLKPYIDKLVHYASVAPLGKRLFLYLNFEIVRPTIFLDSDILFYEKSSCIENLSQYDSSGWFLPDMGWGTLDSRYISKNKPQQYQVNAGFILANKNFDNVAGGLNFLESLDFKYEYFSEQTVMHIVLTDNKYMPLDSNLFVIDCNDQFDFRYSYPFEKIAIRHYTSPVRHKMWQTSWRKQLKIK